MATFDADKKVSALKYKFPGGAQGNIPEPSNHEVNRFQDRLANNLEAIGRPPISDRRDAEEIRAAYADLSVEDMDQLHEWAMDALAELCAGSPSREQIDALGHRMQQAFLNWVQQELVNPEGAGNGTPSLRAV